MNHTTPPDTHQKHPVPAKRRKWLLVTAVTLTVLSLLTIILLPVGIQYGLRNWLLENGAHDVRIDDVDLNPFTGTLLIENIRINVDERNTLKADAIGLNLDWLALAKKRFTLTSIFINGVDIEIIQGDDGELRIGGILIPATGASTTDDPDKPEQDIEESSPWGIGIDAMDFADIGIHYRMPKLEVDTRIEKLSLRELDSWTPDKGAQVSLQASINGAPLKYTGHTALFAKPMRIDGTIDLRNLALGNFQQVAVAADELGGKLSLQTAIKLSLADTGIDVQLSAENIQLDELLFSNKDINLQQKRLNWKGDIGVQQTSKLHLTAKGELASQQLALALPPQTLDIAQQELKTAVNLDFSSDNNGEPNIIALLDKTKVSQLAISANAFPLAGLEQLDLQKLAFHNPGTLDVQQIQLKQFYIAKSAGKKTKTASPALFNNGQLVVEDLSLKDANDLSIKNISLKDAKIFVSRARDGRSNIDDLLAAIKSITATNETRASNEPSVKQKTTSDKPASFHIGHIQVSDDSSIAVEDASTTPITRIDIGIENLSVDNIDNTPPDEVTRLQARGKFGRFGSYTMSGELQPFTKKTNGKLIADIKGIDLPSLSPLTARDLGFRLRSGTLDSDMDIAIKDDQLSGKTQLVLHQLELIPTEEKENVQQGGMTATSLNTSLNMLRDKNNTITLDIPLSGDINAPDFSVQNVINQALMSGVKTGVMTYALLALQPYGTMVVMAKYAGEQISKLRLDPVKFAPGSSEIDATGKDYLSKVAGILTDRPKVDIKVCGVAVASDTAALTATTKDKATASEKEITKQLKKLAKQRSIAVREYLISQTSKDSHQLIGCMPAIENDTDALPRVDLLI